MNSAAFLRTICTTLIFWGCTSAFSASPTKVLGVEIGVAKLDQIQQDLVKKTKVENVGINKYSGGAMLKTDGSAQSIEGLTEVLYVFDENGKLAAVLMDMDKTRFNTVYQFLSSKYKVASQQRPFVGNQFARFSAGDTTIEMDAPHMGFNMVVRYVRNDLQQKYNAQSSAEAV